MIIFLYISDIMNNQDRAEVKKAENVLIASNDPSFNYQFVKSQDNIDNFHETPDIITMNRYDYSVRKDDGDDLHMPSLVPLSLASSQNNLEDMEAFYAAKFPRLPSEYHGILARYSAGQSFTKKEVKNSIKKATKKNQELPVGLTIARKEHTLHFD
tara:strand:- start:548 stop:1015 length:468 start_codon:yes stop_codon:yes gene_type:complete